MIKYPQNADKGRCFGLEQEKGNFKSRVFGGFNRRDVIGYIEALAKERNDLKRENGALRGKLEALEDRLAEHASAEDADCATPDLPDQETLVRARVEEVLKNAHAALDEVRDAYRTFAGDVLQSADETDRELSAMSEKLTALRQALQEGEERLTALDTELDIMPLTSAEATDAESL